MNLLSFLQLNLKTQYIINKNIYRTRFTNFESQFIGNLVVFFELKQFLVSTLNTLGGILCGEIMSERSKI